MSRFQDAVDTFLIRVFILAPVIVILLFLLTLILFLAAPKGSPKRRARRIWFVIISAVGGLALIVWIAVVARLTFAINHA